MLARVSAARAASERTASWRLPAGLYCGVLAVLVAVSWLVTATISPYVNAEPHDSFPGSGALAGWVQWDAIWYQRIAQSGYSGHRAGMQSPVAFFPGYPLAMRLGAYLVASDLLAGILLTVASGLASAVLFWNWCRERMSSTVTTAAAAASIATTSTSLLLLYPYSYYLYGVVYADALFIAATLTAFTALERDRPWLAGIAGAVATFCRPVGIAVAVGLAVRALERRGALQRFRRFGIPTRVDLKRAKPSDGLVLLSLSGLVGYSAFLWTRFGNPILFSSVQQYWGQPATPATWFKPRFFGHIVINPERYYTWGLVAQALLACAAVALVPAVWRRFGSGYGIYTLLVLGIPFVGSKDFQGLGRYVLAAFPVFLLVGQYLAVERPWLTRRVVTISGGLLVLLSAGFAHGLYLA